MTKEIDMIVKVLNDLMRRGVFHNEMSGETVNVSSGKLFVDRAQMMFEEV